MRAYDGGEREPRHTTATRDRFVRAVQAMRENGIAPRAQSPELKADEGPANPVDIRPLMSAAISRDENDLDYGHGRNSTLSGQHALVVQNDDLAVSAVLDDLRRQRPRGSCPVVPRASPFA